MKLASRSVFLAGVFVLAGCMPARIGGSPSNTAEAGGLAVTLAIPKRVVSVGEELSVVVTARNTTGRQIRIIAGSGAPVYVRIQRFGGLSWEEVKRYPEAATMVMSPWTLAGRASRTFRMQLTVEPDWPIGENLRMTAELNGRPEVAPGVTFEVVATPSSAGGPRRP